MNLTIHTYGHIDSMYYTLNAISMIINHKFGQSMTAMMGMVGVAYYATNIAYAGNNQMGRAYLGKVVGMLAIISILLLPRVDMLIYDHVSKKHDKVDNLPLGFAFPVGILESFGNLLTQAFEQAFTQVNNTSYHDYGMVFGARLVQESRSWRIRTPEFMDNMSNFIDRCVMVEAMIGHYYTAADLMESEDIWALVSTNAGNLRRVAMRVGKERTLMRCKDAAKDVIEPAFKAETESLSLKYAKTDFGLAGAVRSVSRSFEFMSPNFKKNIELSFKNYLGTEANAETIMRQQMMMNSLKSYSSQYGYARASAQQESNWRIAGDLSGTYLPILMSVLKCLVYSSFIFLVPLLLISGGWGRYLGFLTLVLSFQLWAPLNSVLNMFIDLYSSNALSGIADKIVSFSTSSRVGNYTDKIVAVASGLQMAIPFLSFSIIQGGVSGFIHLAGTITGASQSAASQAANEAVTGNKSFDNYSTGNQQLYNQSGFKTDFNSSYAAGGSSYQHSDGAMEKVFPGGNALMQTGSGITSSTGLTRYSSDESYSGQINEGIQQQEALIESDQRALSQAERNTFASTVDRVANIAERVHSGESFNFEELGEYGKSMQEAVNQTISLKEQNGYSWEQSAYAGIETSINMSTPFQQILGIGASINAKATVSAQNSSNQSVSKESGINTDSSTSENYNNLVKAASSESWAKDNSIDKSQSEAVRSSYEKQTSIEQQLSNRQESLNNWHEAKSVVQSRGASSSRDMYQEVVDGVKDTYKVDSRTAQRMADDKSPEAQKVWQNLQRQDNYVQNLVSNIEQGKSKVSGNSASTQLSNFANKNQSKINNDASQHLQNHAGNSDIDFDRIKDKVINKEGALKDQHEKMVYENAIQFRDTRDSNKNYRDEIDNQVEKYEEDRIGKGATAKGIAWYLEDITQGQAGTSIGKPDKEVK